MTRKQTIIAITVAVVAILGVWSSVSAQVSNPLWKLQSASLNPVISSWTLTIPALGGSGTVCLQTDNNGLVSKAAAACGSGSGGGGSFPFTPTTNFDVPVNATTGIVWFQNGLQASSTSRFEATENYGTASFMYSAQFELYNFLGDSICAVGNSSQTAGVSNFNVNCYDSGDIFVRNTDGSVGMGTTSPSIGGNTKALTISTAGQNGLAALEMNGSQTTNGGVGAIDFYNNNLRVGLMQVQRSGANNSGKFSIYTANAGSLGEAVTIMPSGKVGISSPDPGSTLTVVTPTGVASPGSSALAIIDSGTGNNAYGFDFALEGVANGDLTLRRINNYATSSVMTWERGTGDVGIGTVSPAAKLDTAGVMRTTSIGGGSPASGAGLEMWYGSPDANTGYILAYDRTGAAYKDINLGQTNQLVVSSNGKVGIGSSTPEGKLVIATNASSDKGLVLASTRAFAGNRNWQIGIDELTEGEFSITPSTAMGSNTFSTQALTINNAGKVTISYASSTALTVSGEGYLDSGLIGTSTASWPLTVYSTGGQVSLSEGTGAPQVVQRWKGGVFSLASTTVQGTATTTPSGLELNMQSGSIPGLTIGTTTSATTTITMGKIQFDGYSNTGVRKCILWSNAANAWTSVDGACTP